MYFFLNHDTVVNTDNYIILPRSKDCEENTFSPLW